MRQSCGIPSQTAKKVKTGRKPQPDPDNGEQDEVSPGTKSEFEGSLYMNLAVSSSVGNGMCYR